MFDFRRLVAKYMREVSDKIEVGTSEITEPEAIDLLKVVAHEVLSKAQACRLLNISPTRFDDYIRAGQLPKGRKVTGYKELRWYKDELEIDWRKIKGKRNKS